MTKRVQQLARNIYVFDEEKAVGMNSGAVEQPQTAAVAADGDARVAHPLRGFLQTALGLMGSAPEVVEDAACASEAMDIATQDDHLIPLYDDERGEDADTFSIAVSFLESVTDSIQTDDGMRAPYIFSAFKRRFMG